MQPADYPYLVAPVTADDGTPTEPALFAIPDSALCQGRGLSIVAVEGMHDCGGGFRLQIANRGSELIADGRITLTRILVGTRGREDSFLDPSTEELPELPPGTVVRTVLFGGGWYLAELATDADPGNCSEFGSQGRVGGPFVDCFCAGPHDPHSASSTPIVREVEPGFWLLCSVRIQLPDRTTDETRTSSMVPDPPRPAAAVVLTAPPTLVQFSQSDSSSVIGGREPARARWRA